MIHRRLLAGLSWLAGLALLAAAVSVPHPALAAPAPPASSAGTAATGEPAPATRVPERDAAAVLGMTARELLEEMCSSGSVSAEITGTFAADLSAAARHQLLAQRRAQLRARLKAFLLERAATLEQSLLPFLALQGPAVPTAVPSQCPYVERHTPAAWSALRRRTDELAAIAPAMQRQARRLFDGEADGGGLYPGVLASAYEIVLLETLFRGHAWQQAPFLPEGLELPEGEFPPVYPVEPLVGRLGPPVQRAEFLLARQPLLRRPATRLLGLPASSVAHEIFEAAFVAPGNSPLEQLAADIGAALDAHHRELAQRSPEELRQLAADEGYPVVEVAGASDAAGPQQAYLLAWQRLLRHELRGIIRQRVDAALADRDLQAPIEQLLVSAARSWHEELTAVAPGACGPADEFVELYPELLALYLREHPDAQPFEQLDAFCHGHWGQTRRTVLEAASVVLAGVSFVASMFAPPLLPLAAVLSTASMASQAERSHRSLQLESALLDPSIADRNLRHATTAVYTVSALLSAPGILRVGGQMLAAHRWRYLMPFFGRDATKKIVFATDFTVGQAMYVKKWIERGKNPLQEGVFWVELVSDYVKSLAMAHMYKDASGKLLPYLRTFMPKLAVYEAVGFIMDKWVQDAVYLMTGAKKNGRTVPFKLWWENSISPASKVLNAVALYWLEMGVGRYSAAMVPVATTVVSALYSYFYATFKSSVYLEYLENRHAGFWEVIFSFDPANFRPEMRHQRKAEADPLEGGLPAVLAALGPTDIADLRAIYATFAADEEPGLEAYFSLHDLLETDPAVAALTAPGE